MTATPVKAPKRVTTLRRRPRKMISFVILVAGDVYKP